MDNDSRPMYGVYLASHFPNLDTFLKKNHTIRPTVFVLSFIFLFVFLIVTSIILLLIFFMLTSSLEKLSCRSCCERSRGQKEKEIVCFPFFRLSYSFLIFFLFFSTDKIQMHHPFQRRLISLGLLVPFPMILFFLFSIILLFLLAHFFFFFSQLTMGVPQFIVKSAPLKVCFFFSLLLPSLFSFLVQKKKKNRKKGLGGGDSEPPKIRPRR